MIFARFSMSYFFSGAHFICFSFKDFWFSLFLFGDHLLPVKGVFLLPWSTILCQGKGDVRVFNNIQEIKHILFLEFTCRQCKITLWQFWPLTAAQCFGNSEVNLLVCLNKIISLSGHTLDILYNHPHAFSLWNYHAFSVLTRIYFWWFSPIESLWDAL